MVLAEVLAAVGVGGALSTLIELGLVYLASKEVVDMIESRKEE